MDSQLTTQSVSESLRCRRDAHGTWQWHEGEPDYVAEYSLTAEHIPGLVALASQWGDEPPCEEAFYGPVIAWRALGQLRAIEVIEPLLAMQDKLAKLHDDWYLQEFHHVYGLVGPPAIPLLSAYLADTSHEELPRAKAAGGLVEIVKHHPNTRDRIVALLMLELSRQQADVGTLNGFLLGELLNLEAVESAETIERAFAAQVIDPTIAGDWGDVRRELDVPGLGIAPDVSPNWPTIREQFDFPGEIYKPAPFADQQTLAATRKNQQKAQRKEKAKRKEQKKDRIRNRKGN